MSEFELESLTMKDLQVLLQLREEELQELRQQSNQVAECRSLLEERLLAFGQMQETLLEWQKRAMSATRREDATERELLQCLPFEQQYHALKKTIQSRESEIAWLQEEVTEIRKQNEVIDHLKERLAACESELELIRLDNYYLREALKAAHAEIPEPFQPE
jgi:DNA repair exonuclease SbcCD ATPase subunit